MRYTTSTVFLPFPRDRAADLRDLGGAGEPGPGRHQHGLDRATVPAAVARAHRRGRGDRGPGQLLQLLVQGRHAGLDGHHVAGAPAGDGLRGAALRVQGGGRDDRPTVPSPASTPTPASAAHWPIAANDLEPAVTAAMPTASSPVSECRRPRLFRGSGSRASRSIRYWLRAAAVREED